MKITIRADEGKWLTDGTNFGKTIDLGTGVNVDNFTEITDAEYEKILKEEEEKMNEDIY